MFCWKCGKEVSPDSTFCEYCGSELNHGKAENASDITSQKKKRSKKRIIPVIVALLVVAIGVGGFFGIKNLLGNSGKDKSSANAGTQGMYLISQKTISYYSGESSISSCINYNVEYDDQGNQLSVKNSTVKDGIETDNWSSSYSYNSSGDLISSSSDITETKTEYTNNENGQEVSSIVYDANGEVAARFEKKYDGENLLSNVRFSADGSMKCRWDYEYDTKGNLIREQWISYTGNESNGSTFYIRNTKLGGMAG